MENCATCHEGDVGAGHADLQTLCFAAALDTCVALEHHTKEDKAEIASLQELSRDARASLATLNKSRTGRELQRWSTVATGDEKHDLDSPGLKNCRLTAGCIPVLNDGRILLISSSKSDSTFVLPKGGWEQDESLPFAALRETLEEAGVTGQLGPALSACTYGKPPGARASTSSSSSPRSYTRLTMFPLYVQCIYDTWPEQHRKRRVVTLDHAIDSLLYDRPEFRHMLIELRERKLHCLSSRSTPHSVD